MIQAAYRGHRARRSSSAVRTSQDGNSPAISAGKPDNSFDGMQPPAANYCYYSSSTLEHAQEMIRVELLYAKKTGFDHYERLKQRVRNGGIAAYTNPADHLAYNIAILEQHRAEDAADAAADAAAAAVLQRERSHSGGSPFRASAGVSRGSDLATPG